MVLEGGNAAPVPSAPGNQKHVFRVVHSQDDGKRYLVFPNGPEEMSVDLHALPQYYLLPSSFQWSFPQSAMTIAAVLYIGRESVKRPLRQREADRISKHVAQAKRTTSLGFFLGAVLGPVLALRMKSKTGSPFSKLFNRGLSRGNGQGPVRTEPASGLTTALRLGSYSLVGQFIGSSAFGLYGTAKSVQSLRSDPELRELRLFNQPGTSHSPPFVVTGSKDSVESGFDGEVGSGGDEDGWSQSPRASTTSYSNDAGSDTTDFQNTTENGNSASSDAPPTKLSAWDRVRQQSGSRSSSSPKSSSSSQSQSSKDDFSADFMSSGEDSRQSPSPPSRAETRSEAQKEFDSRVERERAGQDFVEVEKEKKW